MVGGWVSCGRRRMLLRVGSRGPSPKRGRSLGAFSSWGRSAQSSGVCGFRHPCASGAAARTASPARPLALALLSLLPVPQQASRFVSQQSLLGPVLSSSSASSYVATPLSPTTQEQQHRWSGGLRDGNWRSQAGRWEGSPSSWMETRKLLLVDDEKGCRGGSRGRYVVQLKSGRD